jgi:hypothetical protein
MSERKFCHKKVSKSASSGKRFMTTMRIPIIPQPSGDGLSSPLDGEWLREPFDGLYLPKISDLPMQFNEPNPYPEAGVLVGVIRIDSVWHWECIKIWPNEGRCLNFSWIKTVCENTNPGKIYYPPVEINKKVAA